MTLIAVRYLLLATFLALLQPIATNADERQRPILAEPPERPRFELRDRDWPGKAGEASVCLWKNDALREHDGATYALVQVVPDRGDASLEGQP